MHRWPHPFSISSSMVVKHWPLGWQIFWHIWPHFRGDPHCWPQFWFLEWQVTLSNNSFPQMHVFVTVSRQGGQFPKWHLIEHLWPHGKTFWHGPPHCGCSVPHLMGGSTFAIPHGQKRGSLEYTRHGLQNPIWQKSLHWCTPHCNVLLQVYKHMWSPLGSGPPFCTGQQTFLHLCLLHDFMILQTFSQE